VGEGRMRGGGLRRTSRSRQRQERAATVSREIMHSTFPRHWAWSHGAGTLCSARLVLRRRSDRRVLRGTAAAGGTASVPSGWRTSSRVMFKPHGFELFARPASKPMPADKAALRTSVTQAARDRGDAAQDRRSAGPVDHREGCARFGGMNSKSLMEQLDFGGPDPKAGRRTQPGAVAMMAPLANRHRVSLQAR
jgi:hypothetical protein